MMKKKSTSMCTWNNLRIISISSLKIKTTIAFSLFLGLTSFGGHINANNSVLQTTETTSSIQSDQYTMKGKISEANGTGIPGVSIFIKGTVNGTISDLDGNYQLKVNEGDVLVFSFIGYDTKEIIANGTASMNLILETSSEILDELVITALGIKKSKKALGYSVSKIDDKAIEGRPEANLSKTLQGKVSGLKVSTASGQTGEEGTITIRGVSSITQSNTPLIILNSVPFAGNLSDINPNDIASMNVLKGLSASVLYGSEGRNGVIVIDTKSGSTQQGQKTSLSVSTTAYVNTISQLPEFQNTYGQGQEGEFSGTVYSVWGPAFSDLDEVAHPYSSMGDIFPEYDGLMIAYEAKEDNLKNIFQTGFGSISSFNLSGSQGKTAYNMSGGYASEEGILQRNDMKRYNISIGGNTQLTDKLNIASTLNFSNKKTNLLNTRDIFDIVWWLPRNIDLTELPYENPLTHESVYYRGNTNPLWIMNNSAIESDVVRVYGTFSANYSISDALSISYRLGYDNQQYDRIDHSNKGGYSDDEYKEGYMNIDYSKALTIDQTIMLNFDKSLTKDIGLSAQVGVNSKTQNTKYLDTECVGQIVYGYLRPSNFTASEVSYTTTAQNLAGAFGQFTFDYKNYLFATLSGRNDWGSTVEKENQSLFYPGASVSFIPTTAFDFGGKTMEYLKIRAAYATSSGYPGVYSTRNTLITDVSRYSSYVGGDLTYPVTNRFGSTYANSNLEPELHKEFELGIETRILDNRIQLEASVFKRISENQIFESPLPVSSGYDSQLINLGRIDNKGFEFDLGIDIISNKDFKWKMNNIFYAYESLVVSTTEAGGDVNINDDRWAVEGQALGVVMGNYALTDDEGNFLINGTGSSTTIGKLLNSDNVGYDDEIIGDPNPDFTITSINSFTYKNFRFSAQLEYTHGGEIYSYYLESMLERGVTRDTENRTGSYTIEGVLADATTGEVLLDGNGNKIHNTLMMSGLRTAFSNYYNANDHSTFDMSVFRVREVSLGYTLNVNKSKKQPFERVDFSVSGNNLWYKAPNCPKYVNYDPENDGNVGEPNTPSTKRFSFGVSATF